MIFRAEVLFFSQIDLGGDGVLLKNLPRSFPEIYSSARYKDHLTRAGGYVGARSIALHRVRLCLIMMAKTAGKQSLIPAVSALAN